MHARECKPGLRVIEFGVQPVIHSVARVAGSGKPARNVIRIAGLLENVGVARIALSRKALELADRCALVARIALDRGMGSDQGETVLVVLNIFDGDVPALHRVALLAASTHLAAVDVGVAVSALAAYVGEHLLRMALGTRDVLVHAAQGVAGLIVIEFRYGADRFPTQGRMAILAREIQISVRTPRLGRHLRLRARPNYGEHRQ